MVNTLYLSTAGTASLDLRDSGKITGISLSCVNVATGNVEVSFNSSSQLTTNDTTGTIAGMICDGTSGTLNNSVALGEVVDAGERLFLHVTGASNATRAFVYTDAAAARPATRRR